MSLTRLIALALSVAIAVPLSACAQPQAKNDAASAAPYGICPVMNKPAVATAGKSTYEGKDYYYCCEGCKEQFDADPASFIARHPDSGVPAANVPAAK